MGAVRPAQAQVGPVLRHRPRLPRPRPAPPLPARRRRPRVAEAARRDRRRPLLHPLRLFLRAAQRRLLVGGGCVGEVPRASVLGPGGQEVPARAPVTDAGRHAGAGGVLHGGAAHPARLPDQPAARAEGGAAAAGGRDSGRDRLFALCRVFEFPVGFG